MLSLQTDAVTRGPDGEGAPKIPLGRWTPPMPARTSGDWHSPSNSVRCSGMVKGLHRVYSDDGEALELPSIWRMLLTRRRSHVCSSDQGTEGEDGCAVSPGT